MYFELLKPVTGANFFNRRKELDELVRTIRPLKKGSSKYLALIGQRKIGKTSLLRHFVEGVNDPKLVCYEMDCWEKKLVPKTFFQEYLLQVIDRYLYEFYTDRFHVSMKRSLIPESAFLSLISDIRALKIDALNEATECLLELRANRFSDLLFTAIINFPEKLAQETGIYFVSIIDEFQELTDLNRFKPIKDTIGDIYAFLRANWQRHEKINYIIAGSKYIIAGSKISMMKELVASEHSPFFQHFKIIEINAFSKTDAKKMLAKLSEQASNPIPDEFAERMIELMGTNPFYLQIVASELCEKSITEDSFKIIIQENLFQPVGRLYLYFQDVIGRIVGRSASLEQTLITIARHPGTLSSLAKRMGIGTGTLKSWINRIKDFITVEAGIYRIEDKCLKLWIENKSDLRPILPPLILGTEAEKTVAKQMAKSGFELIYQSRASRGAFGLLAILGTIEVGIQVKKASLPYYIKTDELQLMKYWAGQLSWIPLFALVDDNETLYFYDVTHWKAKGKSFRVDNQTERVENLLKLRR